MYSYNTGQRLAKCWLGVSLLASLGFSSSAAAAAAAGSSEQDG